MAGFIADVYGGRSGNAKRGSDKRRQPVTEKPRQDQHEDDRTRALRYYNAKRYEDAERLYRQLITWSTDADGTIYPVMETHDGLDDWYRLGWNLYRQDRCPEAEPIARKLVQERENITHEALSDASLSNHTMAIETTRVKEMDSNVLLASVLDSQNKSQEAVALAQKLCSDIKSGYDHEGWHSNYLAWILLSNSVFFQAEQILRFAIAERNQLEGWEIHEAYVNLGWALNSQKRWIEAEVALSKAKEYKPYGDIWIEFARMRELSESLLGQERYDEAESQCRALLDLLRKERISRSKNPIDVKYIDERVANAEEVLEEILEGRSATTQTSRHTATIDHPETRSMPLRMATVSTPSHLPATKISAPRPLAVPARPQMTASTPPSTTVSPNLGQNSMSRRATSASTPSLPMTAQALALTPVPAVPAPIVPADPAAQAATTKIAAFFRQQEATTPFTDTQILQMSTLLKHSDPKYSTFPRTYIVLREMDCLHLIDDVISWGFSDFHFPVTESNVPPCVPLSRRIAFVETQGLVLTSSLDLEHGGHRYFQQGETVSFERISILGAGNFGEVDRVLSLITFKEYARKRVPRSIVFANKRQAEMVKQLVTEVETLKRLKHRHVVDMIGSYTDPKFMGILMTPIADSDLSTYLDNTSPSNYPELRTFFGCLGHALKYLHEQNVRHKDIKPNNVLVNRGNVLLTDFGLSFDFSESGHSTTVSMVNGMTARYCAPEVANRDPRNTASDVWSLGIVFLEMLVVLKGRTPESMREYFRTHGSQVEYIHSNHETAAEYMRELEHVGRESDSFMAQWILWMLEVRKEDRPTAAVLVASMAGAPREEGTPRFCGLCCTDEE